MLTQVSPTAQDETARVPSLHTMLQRTLTQVQHRVARTEVRLLRGQHPGVSPEQASARGSRGLLYHGKQVHWEAMVLQAQHVHQVAAASTPGSTEPSVGHPPGSDVKRLPIVLGQLRSDVSPSDSSTSH